MNQNNISFEKVIKGLECCLNADVNDCEMDCPYFDDCGGIYSNNTALLEDALALLKADLQAQQEAQAALETEAYMEQWEPTYNPEDGSL